MRKNRAPGCRGAQVSRISHARLQQAIKQQGKADFEIDSLLGLSCGTFRKQRSRGLLRFADLVDILDFLGIDLISFLKGDNPDAGLQAVSSDGLAGIASAAERLKYDDPEMALRILQPFACSGDAAVYRAIGSSLRRMEAYDSAERWLGASLAAAKDCVERAESLHRLAICIGPKKPLEALSILASVESLLPEQKAEIALNRTAILLWSGDHAAATKTLGGIDTARMSPEILASFHHFKALLAEEEGNVNQALIHLEAALDAGSGDTSSRGHITWTRGRLTADPALLLWAMRIFGRAYVYHALQAGIEASQLIPERTPEILEQMVVVAEGTAFQMLVEGWLERILTKRPVNPRRELTQAWEARQAALASWPTLPE